MPSLNLDPKKPGKAQWKSLEDLFQAPEAQEFAAHEFPEGADVLGADISRRKFLQVMGAGFAFAGVAGCQVIRRPEKHILPYTKMPESLVPGQPQFYATTMSLGGEAVGLLVEAHEGRPTKIEGNPGHPASLGATSRQHQASILDLYNPERSQKPLKQGQASTWETFWKEAGPVFEALKQKGGEGLCFLTGYTASPSFRAVREHAAQAFPKAKWFVYEPVSRDPVLQGMHALTGRAAEPLYHFDRALRILSIDSDFLDSEPNHLPHARGFALSRDPDRGEGMNRLYVVESHYSVTGGSADHRLRLKPAAIPPFVGALALELQTQGLDLSQLGVDFTELAGEYSTLGIPSAWVQAVAADLLQHKGRSVIAVGKYQPALVHALAQALNLALENVGATVEWRPSTVHALNATSPQGAPESSAESLRDLSMRLGGGQVEALVMLDSNPAYASPADHAFGAKIQKAKWSAHLGLEADDTAAMCSWHLPMSHFLESWSDAVAHDGTASIVQPLISPLYATMDPAEFVAKLSGYPQPAGYDIVRAHWSKRHGGVDFEMKWRRWLHDGVIPGEAQPSLVSLTPGGLAALSKTLPIPVQGIELMLREHGCLGDGRFANNAWLQETPDPITKLTWDNAVLLGPKLAEEVGVHLMKEDGTGTPLRGYRERPMVRVTVGNHTLEAAAWVMPGMADDTALLHLGFGRMHAGAVGEGSGFNAYSLMASDSPYLRGGAKIESIDRVYSLACTQDHWSMENRPLVREGTLAEFLHHPEEFASEEKWNEHPVEESLWDEKVRGDYDFSQGMQWGMVIDLNSCTGCNACSVACQSENNIPTVGKEQVMKGREMQWIRIDRYFTGTPEDPELAFQPMTCQQCENAPCEEVCPVAATTHSHEGLNDMAYNRCIGTRYCSNNCPYKVRRFNFFNNNNDHTETEKMRMNPDVTLRFRGVMEKCTYCVQRINHARIDSKNAGSETIADGMVTPACAQVCPSQSIVFGDINDPNSRVAKLKKHPRNYGVLRDLNTKPRTSYLARVRNPNPALEKGSPEHSRGAA